MSEETRIGGNISDTVDVDHVKEAIGSLEQVNVPILSSICVATLDRK